MTLLEREPDDVRVATVPAFDPVACRSVWLEVDGHRAHALAWTAGDRRPVVLVHGMVVASAVLQPIGRELARSVDVWAPDQAGFGRSEAGGVEPRPAPLAAWLRRWMDAAGLERPSLVANSFGCQVATELAMRWPDRVHRLVLASPTTDPTARSYPSILGRFRREQATHSKALDRLLRRDYLAAGVRRSLATLRAVHHDRIEDRLPFVEAETLVVRGTDDPMVPAAWADEVVRLLPRGRLAVLDRVPHAMVHDGAAELAAVAIPFLTKED